MKTIAYRKRVDPGRLSDELVAAGVAVVTIRTSGDRVEVVCDDSAEKPSVDAVVATHDPAVRPVAALGPVEVIGPVQPAVTLIQEKLDELIGVVNAMRRV